MFSVDSLLDRVEGESFRLYRLESRLDVVVRAFTRVSSS